MRKAPDGTSTSKSRLDVRPVLVSRVSRLVKLKSGTGTPWALPCAFG